MGIVAWLVVGGIAGWLAGMVMKSSGGLITDIIVGILGALIGGFIFNLLGSSTDVTGINLPSILVAFIGSCVLLAGLRYLKRG